MTDLSVVVTAHNETAVSGPTMRSADVAIAAAREAGLIVEQVIALDRASDAATAFFCQSRFDDWQRKHFDEGDLGRVRNAVVPETQGRFIAFLDADDLFSENWLAAGVAALEAGHRQARRLIVHPELNWVFDGSRTVSVSVPQDSRLFTPYYCYVRHYYDSLCLAPREAHLEVPYVGLDLTDGLAFEDYQFTIETMAAGWHHAVVADTVIFKRRRDISLVTQSNSRKTVIRSLHAMAIDQIRALGRSS